MDKTLSAYLRGRGLSLDPVEINKGEDAILNDDGLLKTASEIFTAHGGIITMVIQARINAIGEEILNKAIPEEVPVLRQSLVELSALIDDFKVYEAEFKRREQARQQETEGGTIQEPPKEGEESVL